MSCNGNIGKSIPIRTFSYQELRRFKICELNEGIHMWYKGFFEGQIFLIKSYFGLKPFAKYVINELAISAQMGAHSNVLRPVGCCLETPTLILVYEFAAKGILANRIYASRVSQYQQPMAWASRLKIARQIAHATYLHTAFSRPVIHLDIRMENIFLDEHDVPKLFNFLFSRSIPEGETDVNVYEGIHHQRLTSPEVIATGRGTEKTDVYHFGVLLLELNSGESIEAEVSATLQDLVILAGEGGVTASFYSGESIEAEDSATLQDLVILAGEGGVTASFIQQKKAVLDLVGTCMGEDPETRPTMIDVTKELKRIEGFVP